MGDYYSVRFKAILSEAGQEQVRRLLRPPYSWESLPKFKDYADLDGAQLIPFGHLSYAPQDWSQERKLEGATWHVCCSLKKDHPATLASFLSDVLPELLAQACEVEIWDEHRTRRTLVPVRGSGR